MIKKTLTLLSWTLITPLFLLSLTYLTYHLKYSPQLLPFEPLQALASHNNPSVASPVTSQILGVNTQVQTGDARPIILAEFLKKHGSPLTPYERYGQILTQIADEYNLDFRLLPSIMMQESNLCKKIPKGTYNCLGLGIHSQGTWGFDSYEQNFRAAARILRENYIEQGYITPDEIQDKYTPGSNGSWEFAVNHFMDILETAEF